MMARKTYCPAIGLGSSTCRSAAGVAFESASMAWIAPMQRGFSGRRRRACFREQARGNCGATREPTDRGQDKRPQCAARSVVCFRLGFWRVSQCLGSERNVRWFPKSLLNMTFAHIAEAGND